MRLKKNHIIFLAKIVKASRIIGHKISVSSYEFRCDTINQIIVICTIKADFHRHYEVVFALCRLFLGTLYHLFVNKSSSGADKAAFLDKTHAILYNGDAMENMKSQREARRLKALLEHYEYGRMPKAPKHLTVEKTVSGWFSLSLAKRNSEVSMPKMSITSMRAT